MLGVTAGNTDELADVSKETEHCGGKFPVAADEGAKIAAQYDAVLEGRPGWSNRTSYVISPAGEIVHAYSESNPNRHVAETLRSEEHTSELQSLMRISYAVFCLKKKKNTHEETQEKTEN